MSSHSNPKKEPRFPHIAGLYLQKTVVPASRSHPRNKSPRSTPASSSRAARWWVVAPLLLLVGAFAVFRPPNRIRNQDSPAIGKPAPQLDLVLLADEPNLNQLKQVPTEKVTLLHFWGTWCGPCKMEYPELSEMVNHLQSEPRFQFVPVSCESGSNETFEGLKAKTDDYFNAVNIESFSYCDPQGVTRRSTAERLNRNMMFYPTSLVIGTDGRIAGVWEGYAPEAIGEMQETIGRLTENQ